MPSSSSRTSSPHAGSSTSTSSGYVRKAFILCVSGTLLAGMFVPIPAVQQFMSSSLTATQASDRKSGKANPVGLHDSSSTKAAEMVPNFEAIHAGEALKNIHRSSSTLVKKSDNDDHIDASWLQPSFGSEASVQSEYNKLMQKVKGKEHKESHEEQLDDKHPLIRSNPSSTKRAPRLLFVVMACCLFTILYVKGYEGFQTKPLVEVTSLNIKKSRKGSRHGDGGSRSRNGQKRSSRKRSKAVIKDLQQPVLPTESEDREEEEDLESATSFSSETLESARDQAPIVLTQ